MKTITVHIDDDIFEGLLSELSLREFAEGCVVDPHPLERVMMGIVRKIRDGGKEVFIEKKSKDR